MIHSVFLSLTRFQFSTSISFKKQVLMFIAAATPALQINLVLFKVFALFVYIYIYIYI